MPCCVMNPRIMWRLPLNGRYSHGSNGTPKLLPDSSFYSAVSFLFPSFFVSNATGRIMTRVLFPSNGSTASDPYSSILPSLERSTNLWTWDRRFETGTCFPLVLAPCTSLIRPHENTFSASLIIWKQVWGGLGLEVRTRETNKWNILRSKFAYISKSLLSLWI